MNSVEGKKGFITFLLISIAILFLIWGVDFLLKRAQTNRSQQTQDKTNVTKAPNTSADILGIEVLNLSEAKDFSQLIETGIQPIKSNGNDYSGIVVKNELSSSSNKEDVLGTKVQQTDYLRSEEFKEALLFNDLRYDFNKDERVTDADYPLFIEYISNLED